MKNKNEKGIISLITILVIGLFGLGLVLILASVSLVSLNKNFDRKFGERTFYTAETAVREAVRKYQTSNGTITSGSLSTVLNEIESGNTNYTIEPSHLGWQYKKVTATVMNEVVSAKSFFRKIEATFILNPSFASFDYAIFSDGQLEIKGGAGNSITGNVFSNSNVNCSGNPTINGEIFSASSIAGCDATSTSGAEIIPPPTVDISFYQSIADCSSDANHVKDDCFGSSPTSGVIFVNDPTKETKLQNVELSGNLTVRGDLEISGGTIISASNDYFAIIVDGDLKVTGNNTINGIIYVTGKTTFGAGNTVVNGTIISVGGTETDIAGSVTINYQQSFAPPPGIPDSLEPKIINWSEI